MLLRWKFTSLCALCCSNFFDVGGVLLLPLVCCSVLLLLTLFNAVLFHVTNPKSSGARKLHCVNCGTEIHRKLHSVNCSTESGHRKLRRPHFSPLMIRIHTIDASQQNIQRGQHYRCLTSHANVSPIITEQTNQN